LLLPVNNPKPSGQGLANAAPTGALPMIARLGSPPASPEPVA
jgi:hypothetical protein